MRLLAALLRPAETVWDVGAHHGYVTLCAAARVGPQGIVHAFEPSSSNRAALQRHVRWNRLSNVRIHPFALSDSDGECRFGGTGTSKMYALGGEGESVSIRRGVSVIREGSSAPPTFLKIDVEGAEAEALAGTLPILPRSVRLMVAMHGREADERCTRLLEQAGYELIPSMALKACRNGKWRADPDLFCIGPASETRDSDVALLRASGF